MELITLEPAGFLLGYVPLVVTATVLILLAGAYVVQHFARRRLIKFDGGDVAFFGFLALFIAGMLAGIFSGIDTERRQVAALEQQLGYSNISIDDENYTASHDGVYVEGRLVDAGGGQYIVIPDGYSD